MGYPVITRLGLNQFWYKHWYSDKNKNENIQQDKIFTDLINLYLNYGLTYQNNIFFHEYFFSKSYKNQRLFNLKYNLKYFRHFSYFNEVVGIEHSFFIRNHLGEYFSMRKWHIKYNNWVIIIFNCFRPLKMKEKSLNNLKKKEVSAVASGFKYNSFFLNRFKLLYIYIKRRCSYPLSYRF